MFLCALFAATTALDLHDYYDEIRVFLANFRVGA